MKKVLLLVLLAAVASAPVMAITASTEIRINMPSMVILYYRDQVTFDVSDSQLAALVGVSPNPYDEGTATGSGMTIDAGVAGTTYTSPSSVTGTINNFWAVRSIGAPTESTEVTVSIPTPSMSNGTDTITLSSPLIRLTAGSFSGTVVSFGPTGFGGSAAQLGDVQFTVDMSGATTSGMYDGAFVMISAVNV